MEKFEEILNTLCKQLRKEAQETKFSSASQFELLVRNCLADLVCALGLKVEFNPHPHVFPDIVLGEVGVEVKFTEKNTWRSVANSVFESTKSPSVKNIYVVFGKMGETPDVKWAKYEDCVIHVRTSHVPRFELEIGSKSSLFKKLGISYEEFGELDDQSKMRYIRDYARSRLKQGERLWWLDDDDASMERSLPIQARLYTTLDQSEKRMLRAEAAILCPQVVKPSRAKHKYDDVTLYLLTCHGVLCPQARDLFSAGSVALRADATRGGNYILRALQDIENEMRIAATELEDALFLEYWGIRIPEKNMRIREWLKRADKLAVGWKPSDSLFRDSV